MGMQTQTRTDAPTGSAPVQGALWGAQARDWADLQEGQSLPLFESALVRAGIGQGVRLLDVGCGAGMFCQLAAQRGALVAGFDAAAAFIDIARERTPGGDFRVGEMETLPYADGSFDIVTGLNSFQYAANPVNAIREARRVARSGSPILIATWGDQEKCEAATYITALGSLLPPPPPGTPGPFALSQPGALEKLASEAGLKPVERVEVECVWSYPDLQTTLRATLSAGPAVRAINIAGEAEVVARVTEAIAPFRLASGAYRLENVFSYVIASA